MSTSPRGKNETKDLIDPPEFKIEIAEGNKVDFLHGPKFTQTVMEVTAKKLLSYDDLVMPIYTLRNLNDTWKNIDLSTTINREKFLEKLKSKFFDIHVGADPKDEAKQTLNIGGEKLNAIRKAFQEVTEYAGVGADPLPKLLTAVSKAWIAIASLAKDNVSKSVVSAYKEEFTTGPTALLATLTKASKQFPAPGAIALTAKARVGKEVQTAITECQKLLKKAEDISKSGKGTEKDIDMLKGEARIYLANVNNSLMKEGKGTFERLAVPEKIQSQKITTNPVSAPRNKMATTPLPRLLSFVEPKENDAKKIDSEIPSPRVKR